MTGFSSVQLRKLTGKLDRSHVQSRKMDEREVDYIEGWFAIGEANAIFGFGGWDREMTQFERVFERSRGDVTNCSYFARVRIRVRAGADIVVREGTGWGAASARNPADAHERAIKAAETDGTKRALATFGNRFGLGLYDKEQAGVTPRDCPAPTSFSITSPDGTLLVGSLSPEGFCSGLRQIAEQTSDQNELSTWLDRNRPQIDLLKTIAPSLKNSRGEHYGELLERLFRARLARHAPQPSGDNHDVSSNGAVVESHVPANDVVEVAVTNVSDIATCLSEPIAYPLSPSRIADGPRIDKAALAIRTTRRLRDKDHLRQVGALPCLICQAVPSHPHHLTFAQRRGLALKVSDEFVVPLCVLHHNDMHRCGAETLWWKRLGIEPLIIARELGAARASIAQPEATAAE
jgi:DNA recombination protein Rad52